MRNTLILLILAGAAALALAQSPGALAFWSPVSPVAGCEGLADLAYAQCCLNRTGRLDLCPADALIPDPVHDGAPLAPQAGPAAEKPQAEKKHAHRDDDAEPVHGPYRPPICWAVSPGRQLCVWEGIWSAPEVRR